MARLLPVFVLLFLLFCCASSEPDLIHRFLKFIDDFRKPYKNGTLEFLHRLEIFKNNLHQIEKMNEPYKDGPAVFGITKFSDLSQEEFKEQYLNDLRPNLRNYDTTLRFQSEKKSSGKILAEPTKLPLPKKVDWRDSGVVSPVKNQRQCGACWAFAATEAIESAFAIAHNVSAPILAVQQLIDCSKTNHGCEGGDLCVALDYVQKSGITYESVYPLTDTDGTCHLTPGDKTIELASFKCRRLVGDEEQILTLLATVGPLAVAVDATTWNNYIGGIIKFHCSSTVNHAVDIVGYDLTGPVPYYIVRNSWGTEFGIKGFMYIKVGENLCGIAEEVSDVYLDLD